MLQIYHSVIYMTNHASSDSGYRYNSVCRSSGINIDKHKFEIYSGSSKISNNSFRLLKNKFNSSKIYNDYLKIF